MFIMVITQEWCGS